jgi:hypothetical protein
MTLAEAVSRDRQTLRRIECVLRTDENLADFAQDLQIRIESSVIVVGGQLPNERLCEAIVPMIRRAGVLEQISNEVTISEASFVA